MVVACSAKVATTPFSPVPPAEHRRFHGTPKSTTTWPRRSARTSAFHHRSVLSPQADPSSDLNSSFVQRHNVLPMSRGAHAMAPAPSAPSACSADMPARSESGSCQAASTGARSARVAGAKPNSRSTRFNAASENLVGAVISTPIGCPPRAKSMTRPGSTRRVR